MVVKAVFMEFSPLNDQRIGELLSSDLYYPPKIARTMKAPSIRAQHICDPSFSFWDFLSIIRMIFPFVVLVDA